MGLKITLATGETIEVDYDDYEKVDFTTPEGKAVYQMTVQINRTAYGKGKGHSKKEAEQAAAKETLALMGEI